MFKPITLTSGRTLPKTHNTLRKCNLSSRVEERHFLVIPVFRQLTLPIYMPKRDASSKQTFLFIFCSPELGCIINKCDNHAISQTLSQMTQFLSPFHHNPTHYFNEHYSSRALVGYKNYFILVSIHFSSKQINYFPGPSIHSNNYLLKTPMSKQFGGIV